MLWHGERQGQGVSLSGERSVAGRHAKKAWGVQLADQWMSKDVHVIALLLEQVTEHCYIGVVGRNYFPSAWDAPLKESTHATVVHAADGRVFTKRSSTSFFLKPLESGVATASGGELRIVAHGASASNVYVSRAELNGAPLLTPLARFGDITRRVGSTLELWMVNDSAAAAWQGVAPTYIL